jgi:hypothetical protein
VAIGTLTDEAPIMAFAEFSVLFPHAPYREHLSIAAAGR